MLVGRIVGKTSPEAFQFEVSNIIRKMDFITARDPERHWVLGRVEGISQEKNQTLAQVSVVGYSDKRQVVKMPRMPFKPGSYVYKADDGLIKRVLGLKSSGLYVGLLDGSENLKVNLDPKLLVTKHLAILAKSGFGKCVSGDTPILTYKDGLIPIDQIFNSSDKIIKKSDNEEVRKISLDVVSLDPNNLKFTPKKALYAYKKRCDKTYIIRTNSGRKIEVSPEHPFLTIKNGKIKFARADKLDNSSWVGIPRKIEIRENEKLKIHNEILNMSNDVVNTIKHREHLYEKAIRLRKDYDIGATKIAKQLNVLDKRSMIDHWIYRGDKPPKLADGGSFTVRGNTRILKPINLVEKITLEFSRFLAYTIAESVEVINESKNYYRIGFRNDSGQLTSDFKNLAKSIFGIDVYSYGSFHYLQSWNLKMYLDSIGYITGSLSGDKSIPNFLLYSTKEALTNFLRAFFDCDGWVEKNSVGITTKSKHIANKISYMLLRLGIHSRIYHVFKRATNTNQGNMYYSIYICGSDNLKLFKKFIGFSLEYKNKKLNQTIRSKSNTNVDVIPEFGKYIKKIRRKKKLSQSQLGSDDILQASISAYERSIQNPSISSFQTLAKKLDDNFMEILADSDVFWDRIKSIEINNEEKSMYDLTVEDNHTFVGGFGGIILHNSYFAGVLLEEFMENQIPAVIIDPHGEYLTLRTPNKKSEETKYMPRFDVKTKGYSKELQIYCLEKNLTEGAKKLKFRNKLSHQELLEMLPFRLTSTQLSVIYTAMADFEKPEYTLKEIKEAVIKAKSRAKWNVLSVLDMLKTTGLFEGPGHVSPQDMVKKGKLTIVNLKGIEPDVQQLVVYKLARELFEARKKNKIQPFLFVVEESHNFCPERGFGEAISSRILRTLASEGRKFGLGLCVISQRPARIDKNVLSQCNTQVFLRVTNPNDLRSIMDSVEGITKGLESQIKTLPIGTGVVVGLIEQPLLVNIRVKRSNHGGAPMMLPEKFKEREESDMLYFYPKFLEEDIKSKMKKKLQQFKLVYYPLYRLKCKFNTPEGEKIDSLFVDGLSGELVYSKNDAIIRTDGLPRLLGLGMKEKAVLLLLTSYGVSTFDNMVKKLKINEKTMMQILSRLKKLNLISIENQEFKSNLNLNFEDIINNQLAENVVNYKYAGDLLPFKISMKSTNGILDLFSPDAVERKMCYYPYWFVFFDDGDVEVIDALTGEKDSYLKEKNILDNLPF